MRSSAKPTDDPHAVSAGADAPEVAASGGGDQAPLSAPPASALEIRDRIRRDHALLRGLTRALVGAAKAAEQDEKQRYVVREILGQLLVEAARHFEYEEQVAGPLLRDAEAWGPICEHRMVKEHDEQRTTLLALAEDAEDGVRSTAELADELGWFFRRFDQDMHDEEERLLSAGRAASPRGTPGAIEPPRASRVRMARR